MKKLSLLTLLLMTPFFTAVADETQTTMTEDKDGVLVAGEYEVISTNGSITRSKCPYTCEMRGLPKQYCKTWQSLKDKELCYVQDTRIPSNAIEFGANK